jgi:succinyl-diaminopimelate desuccinylase
MAFVHPTQPSVSDEIESSVLDLTRRLVRTPSRAGLDDYAAVFGVLRSWLDERGLDSELLESDDEGPIALVAEVAGSAGPTYVLNATVDTAGFGDEDAWSVAPTGAEVRDGWLYGRGSADSKAGAAIFCHVAAALREHRHRLRGSLKLIFDAEEHTGSFAGIRRALAHHAGSPIAGAMLGYPGMDKIGVGGRGYERAVVTVHGRAAHSASSSDRGSNAIVAAARLVERLAALELPVTASPEFPLSPRLTVTMIEGGHGFSEVPDLCRLNVDVRLTPPFGRDKARELVSAALDEWQAAQASAASASVEWLGGWPAYRLSPDSAVAIALTDSAAAVLQHPVVQGVVGPSNVGNFLFQQGIEATCGFGVAYRRAHASDECIDLATLRPVYDVYLRAVRQLLLPG